MNNYINDYYHWVMNYITSLIPDDYIISECGGSWPTLRPAILTLVDPEKEIPKILKKYNIERIASELPSLSNFFVKAGRNKTENEPDYDNSYRDILEKKSLEKMTIQYAGWNGIIKISDSQNSVYFFAVVCNSLFGFQTLTFTAFKNKKFLEELLTDLHYAEQETTKAECKKVIFCHNGPNIEIERITLNRVILPFELKNDIISSTEIFFKKIDFFKNMGVPSKRGFLFTGPPGNGKTLLCFALARHIAINYKARIVTLHINKDIDNNAIRSLYEWANNHCPAMVILEDIETILTETQVTRSGFLNILDGMRPERGILTIATTNYPEKLDPALAHRPSRFDRVWNIPTPDNSQRSKFISKLFQTPELSDKLRKNIVAKTNGWSMAYIQELKATAVVSAVQNDRDHLDVEDFSYALDKLSAQFISGKKNHRYENGEGTGLGFFE